MVLNTLEMTTQLFNRIKLGIELNKPLINALYVILDNNKNYTDVCEATINCLTAFAQIPDYCVYIVEFAGPHPQYPDIQCYLFCNFLTSYFQTSFNKILHRFVMTLLTTGKQI